MPSNSRGLLLLPLLLLLAANTNCRYDDDLGVEHDVDFETLRLADGTELKGTTSGIVSHQLTVVRNAGEFTGLWEKHIEPFSPAPEEPGVNFDTDMVIAVFAGEQASGGYAIEVMNVRENDEFMMVDVEFTRPGETCIVTQALTQPFHFVVLEADDKPMNFDETTLTKECGQ